MSLKKFSELFVDLDSSNSTNNKIEVLKNYFLSNDPIDNSWAIYLLTGKSNRTVSYTHLTLPTNACV